MFEKEPLHKKTLIKLVKNSYKGIWISLILTSAFVAFFLYILYWAHTLIDSPTISQYLLIGAIILICVFLYDIFVPYRDAFLNMIKLHKGKFYIVEAPLVSKSKKEKYDHTAGRKHRGAFYTEYSFYFDKYGAYRTGYYTVFYEFSKHDKMEPEMADLITDPGDEFYLLVRGGKKKKVFAIFHKKLFELQEYEFTQMYGKYYL